MRSIILWVLPVLSLSAALMVQGNDLVKELTMSSLQNRKLSGTDTVEFDQDEALMELRLLIKGRESDSAGEVFENIRKFENLSAARLLNVMEKGFSRSLGVKCTHCHNPKDWGSDEKLQKQIAREMMELVGTINTDLLANIENLDSERPTVNCTTCHRGKVKPALNLGY